MKKKILWAVVAAVVVPALPVYFHYVPLWAVLVSVVAFAVGGSCGWIAKGRVESWADLR